MPTSAELKSYLLERLQVFDPTLDATEGSPIHRQVIDPLLAKIGEDPFSTDIRAFILARLSQAYPELDVLSAGSALDATIIGPIQLLLEPFRREIAHLRAGKSLASPEQLAEAEADALLANVFELRQEGDFARVDVRCYFPDKRTILVDATVTATSVGGLKFYSVNAFTLTAEEMALQVENGFYYADITFEAAEEGDAFNIGVNEIARVDGLPGIVKVTNKLKADGGVPRESTEEFLARAETAIGERSPNTDAGVANKILAYFPSVRAVRTIGYGEPEMVRDVIKGSVSLDETSLGLGAIVLEGSAGEVLDVVLPGSDETGPGLGYLELPSKSFRLQDAGEDFSVITEGDALSIKGRDRGVARRTGLPDTELWVDDFEILAKGTSGYTLFYDVPGGTPLIYGYALYDDLTNFVARGVAVGDVLRVQGLWAAGTTQPTANDRNPANPGGGPGNAQVDYFPIIGVLANGVVVTEALNLQVVKKGRPTGDNGCNVDGGVPLQVLLNPASTETFALEPAVLPGDFITLYKVDSEGTATSFGPEEWEIDSVIDARTLALVAGSTPTDYQPGGADDYQVRWTIRRSTYSKSRLLLGSSIGNEWAILRYRQSIRELADPESYPWLHPSSPMPPGADTNLSYTARRRVSLAEVAATLRLTLSDVPGGVSFPRRAPQEITVLADDEIHIGGCTDAYVHQPSVRELTADFEDLIGESFAAQGADLGCLGASDIVSATSLNGVSTHNRMALVILSGDYAGVYRVVASGGTPGALRLDTSFATPFAGVRYLLIDQLTLALDAPRVHRVDEGTGLSTSHQSALVQDLTRNFVNDGVEVGDTLEILSGSDKGTYVILEVVSNTRLLLHAPLEVTAQGLSYDIYWRLDALIRPFRRLTRLELLSSGNPSGVTIPYSEPVDIRTSEFSNVGQGSLLSGESLAFVGVDGGTVILYDTTGVDFSLFVSPGDILKIRSGPNQGTYVIGYVSQASYLTLYPLPPLRETLPWMVASFTYENLVGSFQAGEVISSGGIDFGTIVSDTPDGLGGGTLEVAMTSVVPSASDPLLGADSGATATLVDVVGNLSYEIGPPSIGTARCYFDELTMFEARTRGHTDPETTIFQTEDGRRYVPDYKIGSRYLSLEDTDTNRWLVSKLLAVPYTGLVGTFNVGETLQRSAPPPAPPGYLNVGTILRVMDYGGGEGVLWVNFTEVTEPSDLELLKTPGADAVAEGASVWEEDCLATTTDLPVKGAEVDDQVQVTTVPLIGLVDLSGGANVSGLTLSLSLGEGPTLSVSFSGANPIALDQVSPAGIVQQVEAAFPGLGVTVLTQGAVQKLVLHSSSTLTLQACSARVPLFNLAVGTTNESANAGTYLVADVLSGHFLGALRLRSASLGSASLVLEEGPKLTLWHLGSQRTGPKAMALQQDETGLYYVDIELRSVEPGDVFNLPADTVLTVSGHRSYGWRLRSRNEALTFSAAEQVDLEVTPLILDPLLDDDLENQILIPLQDLRLTYEYADVVSSAQALLLRDQDRVVNNNPMAKVMLPAFVRVALSYYGGSKAVVVKKDVVALINEVQPTIELEAARLYDLLRRRGALKVTGPIELLALRHKVDRSIDTIRSKDRLSVGRTSKLIADETHITVTKG